VKFEWLLNATCLSVVVHWLLKIIAFYRYVISLRVWFFSYIELFTMKTICPCILVFYFCCVVVTCAVLTCISEDNGILVLLLSLAFKLTILRTVITKENSKPCAAHSQQHYSSAEVYSNNDNSERYAIQTTTVEK